MVMSSFTFKAFVRNARNCKHDLGRSEGIWLSPKAAPSHSVRLMNSGVSVRKYS